MLEIKVENPSSVFDYLLRGEDENLLEEAAKELRHSLEYINSLPYNMTNTVEQKENAIAELKKRFNIEISKV